MHVAFLQELSANGLSGAALEEDVVRYHDCCSPVDLQAALYVLEEVELLVARRGPEVIADYVRLSFASSPSSLMTVMLDFFPNGGFVKHHVVRGRWLLVQAIRDRDRALVAAYAM